MDWLVALNDIEWLEWFWNDGLKVEWCPLSFQGVASSQSTHHPLQRMMGGLTCLFEWYWMIRMILKWRSQFGMMDSVIPEWLRNDGMRMKCLCLKLSSQPKPVKIGASYWSRAQNRGLWLVERTLKKYLRGLPWFENVRHSPVIPTFWHHSVIEEKLNDKGMTNQVDPPAYLLYREWHRNEGMTIEWQIK